MQAGGRAQLGPGDRQVLVDRVPDHPALARGLAREAPMLTPPRSSKVALATFQPLADPRPIRSVSGIHRSVRKHLVETGPRR